MYWLKLVCLWLADRIEAAGDLSSLALAEKLRDYHARALDGGGAQLMYHVMNRESVRPFTVRLSRFMQRISGPTADLGDLNIPPDDANPNVGVIIEIPLIIGRKEVTETRFTATTRYETEEATCTGS